MSEQFKIALLQLNPYHNIQKNLLKGLQACEQARKLGADLAVFPELWHVGCQQSFLTVSHAIDRNSDFIQQFCAKAKELEMAIAITYLGKSAQQPTNNVMIIDRTGTILLDYAKINICDFEDGCDLGLDAGEKFYVTSLDYAHGTVDIGAMICFDREFPESAHRLAQKGAEIIIVPNACRLLNDPELGDIRLQQIRTRAFENMVVMAVTNYPAPADDGNSCICAANGSIISQAGSDEEITITSIDLTALRTWRQNEPWGPR